MEKSILCLLFMSSTLISNFKLGIENCESQFPIKKITTGKNARIGLIANQTRCDQKRK